MSDTLLTLRDVHINFPARKNWLGKTTEHVHAINGIDLQIRRGETLGSSVSQAAAKHPRTAFNGYAATEPRAIHPFRITTHYADGVSGPALFA